MENVYQRLARHLDRLPAGFPATESGVELRILARLFTPEEAATALGLSLMPEPVEAIAGRLGGDTGSMTKRLQEMSRKGLIFRTRKKNQTLYMASQFMIGIWEYHVNDLDEDLIRDVNEYIPHLVRKAWVKQPTKQLRVIPVSRSIAAGMEVMPYEQAEAIIKSQSKITVAPCICRKEHRMVGKGCTNPMEVCLSFGSGAYYYEENGLGRPVTQEEALAILEKGLDAGLVLQPGNARKPANICMCCGCCCQVLKNLKQMENPAEAVVSNFQARVDPDQCTGCGVCSQRCHMEAIDVEETAVVDRRRCIGCGVCVPACEFDAISLEAKEDRYRPPANTFETYFAIAKERGLL